MSVEGSTNGSQEAFPPVKLDLSEFEDNLEGDTGDDDDVVGAVLLTEDAVETTLDTMDLKRRGKKREEEYPDGENPPRQLPPAREGMRYPNSDGNPYNTPRGGNGGFGKQRPRRN